jgi:4'-phosphopantetheinyl transferase
MTGLLPPVRAWSKNPENRCTPGAIPQYWKTHDVITFLADTCMYDPSLYNGLDSAEKERVLQFKSDYFKKRFIVSRFLAKSILRRLPGTANEENVVISRGKKGMLVQGRKDLFFSLSYSGSCIALSLGKRKIGSDIEMVNAGEIRKVLSSPLYGATKCGNRHDDPFRALQLWTLVESYAKFRDINPFPLLTTTTFLPDTGFMSYCFDTKAMFSLAYPAGNLDHAMFWIDPATFAADVKKETCSSSLPGGDLNACS